MLRPLIFGFPPSVDGITITFHKRIAYVCCLLLMSTFFLIRRRFAFLYLILCLRIFVMRFGWPSTPLRNWFSFSERLWAIFLLTSNGKEMSHELFEQDRNKARLHTKWRVRIDFTSKGGSHAIEAFIEWLTSLLRQFPRTMRVDFARTQMTKFSETENECSLNLNSSVEQRRLNLISEDFHVCLDVTRHGGQSGWWFYFEYFNSFSWIPLLVYPRMFLSSCKLGMAE